MPFEFKSEFERNPTNVPAPVIKTDYDDIKAQLEEVNEFIDENRLLQTFYAWKALREQLNTGAEVIE
jgi:hypothetical protein